MGMTQIFSAISIPYNNNNNNPRIPQLLFPMPRSLNVEYPNHTPSMFPSHFLSPTLFGDWRKCSNVALLGVLVWLAMEQLAPFCSQNLRIKKMILWRMLAGNGGEVRRRNMQHNIKVFCFVPESDVGSERHHCADTHMGDLSAPKPPQGPKEGPGRARCHSRTAPTSGGIGRQAARLPERRHQGNSPPLPSTPAQRTTRGHGRLHGRWIPCPGWHSSLRQCVEDASWPENLVESIRIPARKVCCLMLILDGIVDQIISRIPFYSHISTGSWSLF